MRCKIFSLAGFGLLMLVLAGCASTELSRLDDVSPDEAVAVARIRIKHNGDNVTKGSFVGFNVSTGIVVQNEIYMLDESGYGYVFAKLPIGKNSITHVNSGIRMHRFSKEILTCELRGGGVINYIGDITMDWQGISNFSATGILIAAGPVANAFTTQGTIITSVESNVAETQKTFRQRFPNDQNLIPVLLVVNSPQSPQQPTVQTEKKQEAAATKE